MKSINEPKGPLNNCSSWIDNEFNIDLVNKIVKVQLNVMQYSRIQTIINQIFHLHNIGGPKTIALNKHMYSTL